jgi:hypothetical protein
MSIKNTVTPSGIKPTTFRFVVQGLNHCVPPKASLESTQTYVTLTAEMFPYITEAIEAACGNIIPALEGMA